MEMNLIERHVIKVNKENKTQHEGTIMYELNLTVNDYGHIHNVDVILLEDEYNMMKEKGYYLC